MASIAKGTTVEVEHIGQCQVCTTQKAEYDTKTVWGSWAYCCRNCFTTYGVGGLGIGRGQKLVLKKTGKVA